VKQPAMVALLDRLELIARAPLPSDRRAVLERPRGLAASAWRAGNREGSAGLRPPRRQCWSPPPRRLVANLEALQGTRDRV
jgi:hypothetical protein